MSQFQICPTADDDDKTKPRVLWDMTFTVRSLTGTRVYTQKLFQAIAAQGAYDLGELYGNREAGVPRRGTLRSNARNILWLLSGLENELKRAHPVLFHAAAYLGPLRAPCPMILNVFDTTYAAFPRDFDWKFRFYARTFIPSAIRRASAILTLSGHARGELMRLYGLPGERVHIVPPGVGAEFHPLDDPNELARVRAKYDLPEKYLIYVGGRNHRKNVPVLIAAFARARREIPDLHLVLAGPRSGPHATDAPISASGAAHAIRQLDFVPEADLPALYADARACIFASRLEGFGMPPVEAMACGTPVVAAPNPPMPEVLGDAAWFTANDSVEAMTAGILRVLGDDALRVTLRERGIERAHLYAWTESARKTIGIYDHVLARARLPV